MDEHRMQPPTATDLIRLVEARIITVDEARQFLSPEATEMADAPPLCPPRRRSGTHAADRMVI
jgi:hypothetical protein